MSMGVRENHNAILHNSIFNCPDSVSLLRMKHLVKITLIISCISIISCKKYEEGPAFSLMSKKARLSNIWQVNQYLLNGEDKTEAYRQLITREKLVIYQSGRFDYSEVHNWVWAVT